jgi:hypothetical protein
LGETLGEADESRKDKNQTRMDEAHTTVSTLPVERGYGMKGAKINANKPTTRKSEGD